MTIRTVSFSCSTMLLNKEPRDSHSTTYIVQLQHFRAIHQRTPAVARSTVKASHYFRPRLGRLALDKWRKLAGPGSQNSRNIFQPGHICKGFHKFNNFKDGEVCPGERERAVEEEGEYDCPAACPAPTAVSIAQV